MAETFRCTLVTPSEQVLDAAVTYASIPAWDGQVGLMNDRAPLLVKLGYGALRLDEENGGKRWYFIGGGFAQMKSNRLTLLTDEAVAADAISETEARAALKEAEAFVPHTDEQFAKKERDLRRARVMLDLATRRR